MKQLLWAFVFLIAGVTVALGADEDSKAVERTRQTLLYGIDSQVLDMVQRISSTKDTRFTKELASILADTRSPDLKKAVLGVFEDQKLKEGEATARQFLSDTDQQTGDIVAAAIHYLSTIGAQGLAPLLTPLIDSPDNAVASAAIRACGKSGEAACAAVLETKLKDPDFPDARKADVILALGDMKDQKAVDELIDIAKNTDEDKVRRLYAADSLGKIGDARALPALKAMFAERDALVRAYAASALTHFGMQDVFPMLVQGLKDDDWKVREQCAKALAAPLDPGQAGTVIPALEFKARYDPVSQVRSAAIKALGASGNADAADTLAEIYKASGAPLDSREAALDALVSSSQSKAIDAVKAVIGSEGKSVDQKPLVLTARVLSTAQGSGFKEIYVDLLASSDASVRAYAVRGIAANGFSDLKERVTDLSHKDPSPLVQREAERALSKL